MNTTNTLVLKTERLILRKFMEDDMEALYEGRYPIHFVEAEIL